MTKTVIVTGGSNGIGREIVVQYAQKGYNVVIADIDEKAGGELVKKCHLNSLQVIFVKTDVSQINDIKVLMKETVDRYHSIDILINNAGVSKWQSPYDITTEEWDSIISTNLKSVMFASREAAKVMRNNLTGGKIINLASTRAFMSEKNSEAYAASKGGIVALTHALAVSLGDDNIQVNAISPGWIETGDYQSLREIDHKQHISKRVGKPTDIAKACLYLTMEDNDFITGINLTIDGGITKKMMYEE